ncbi:MAG TPA: hypothetical protein VIQ80_00040 [Candidatus Saccharimonadales bacterium]
MNDNELTNKIEDSPVMMPTRSTTYEMLVRQSKKMGRVATRAFHDVRTILHKEVQIPHFDRFITRAAEEKPDPKKEKELREADRLKSMVKRSHQVLASARTVWIMTLFPDSIVVDRTKISIIKRSFFWNTNVISFQVEDVLNVSCSLGPLFGSLTIASRVMSTIDHFNINYLWRGEAIFMKHLIQGHIIAKNNKLETDKLTRKELVEMLCELGADADV